MRISTMLRYIALLLEFASLSAAYLSVPTVLGSVARKHGLCLRASQGGSSNEDLKALAEKLKQGMGSWTSFEEDSLPSKKGKGKVTVQKAIARPSKENSMPGKPLDKSQMKIRVEVTRAGKGGKTVTVVKGFDGIPMEELKSMVKDLKVKIGSGGKVTEDKCIELQGEHSGTAIQFLIGKGFTGTKLSGGLPSKK
uniref:SUI1 domain-containing protein n=1 Tax=Hanusia phi TaxID=3032 RepID=A0A7S0HKY1_9CRYP|mmetsp:Transcript_23312/g.52359  ORF Transcript_23312/g.52359 Transcript_23312/m.52359 type:complete len:195 (+) Transcript_23312:71-655(+)